MKAPSKLPIPRPESTLSPYNATILDELVTVVTLSANLTLLFARYNLLAERDQLMDVATQRLAKSGCHEVFATDNIDGLTVV